MYTPNPNCQHCKEPLKIRNPSGYCDHLYYPDNCEFCRDTLPLFNELLDRFADAWKELAKK